MWRERVEPVIQRGLQHSDRLLICGTCCDKVRFLRVVLWGHQHPVHIKLIESTYHCTHCRRFNLHQLDVAYEVVELRRYPGGLLERRLRMPSVPVLIVARYRWILVVHVGGHSAWMAVERAGVYFLAKEDPTRCEQLYVQISSCLLTRKHASKAQTLHSRERHTPYGGVRPHLALAEYQSLP